MTKITIGMDEVGRGCWAGPLVVGAVVLTAHIPGLRDSKVLTKSARAQLAVSIRQVALGYALGWVDASEVDQLGLTKATQLAIRRCLDCLPYYDEIIIDGSYNYLSDDPKARCLIGADGTVASVSAASILAKVARDNYMAEQAVLHPEYGFESHVGYGTPQHRKAIIAHGVTALHRTSYKPIKAILSGAG